jgi:hypothetical protein
VTIMKGGKPSAAAHEVYCEQLLVSHFKPPQRKLPLLDLQSINHPRSRLTWLIMSVSEDMTMVRFCVAATASVEMAVETS